MRRVKVVLIGAGRRSAAHLPVLSGLTDHFDFVGICDLNPQAAAEKAREYGVSAYHNVEHMFETAQPELVILTVPADGHHVLAAIAAEYKTHMYIETPLALSRTLMDFIIDCAHEAGVIVEVSEQVQQWPHLQTMRRIVDSGIAGRPVRAFCRYDTAGYHACNGLRFLAGGAPVRVRCIRQTSDTNQPQWRGQTRRGKETWDLGFFEFDNGATGILEVGDAQRAPLRSQVRKGWRLDTTDGLMIDKTLYLPSGDETVEFPFEEVRTDGDFMGVRVGTDPVVDWQNPTRNLGLKRSHDVATLYLGMHRAIVEGTEPLYGLRQARIDQEMSLAMTFAGDIDESVTLPLPTENTPWENWYHENYRYEHGHDPLDIDALRKKIYPRI